MTLDALKALNPQVPLYTVEDPEFKRFGRVLRFDTSEIVKVCNDTLVMPSGGALYDASMDALEMCGDAPYLRDVVFGECPAQIGICYGHSNGLNALEYHRSSEINVAATDLVLLLADERDMTGNDLHSDRVLGFLVRKGQAVEVYGTTLHYCPCEVSKDGFQCVVVLPLKTNLPLNNENTARDGEARLLFRKNKWIICCEDQAGLISKGVYPGLHGENFTVRY